MTKIHRFPEYHTMVKLIASFAWQFKRIRPYMEFEELMAQGNVAFAEARRDWDPERGAFITILYNKLRKYIQTYTNPRNKKFNPPYCLSDDFDFSLDDNRTEPDKSEFIHWKVDLSPSSEKIVDGIISGAFKSRTLDDLFTELKHLGLDDNTIGDSFQEISNALRENGGRKMYREKNIKKYIKTQGCYWCPDRGERVNPKVCQNRIDQDRCVGCQKYFQAIKELLETDDQIFEAPISFCQPFRCSFDQSRTTLKKCLENIEVGYCDFCLGWIEFINLTIEAQKNRSKKIKTFWRKGEKIFTRRDEHQDVPRETL